MRIDEIETGAEYTDDRTHFARDVRPRRYRAEAIETRDATRRRAQRVVMLTELDPETGDVIPEGVEATGGRWPQTSRTGGWLRASDLEPYGPAREAWVAWRAAHKEVAALTVSLRSHLVDPADLPTSSASTVKPVVRGPYRDGSGPFGRVELDLTPAAARKIVAALERLEARDTGAGPLVAQEITGG